MMKMSDKAAMFITTLFDNDRDHDYMTLETATTDLEYFASQGDEIPSDLTPELYMNTWNELVEAERAFWNYNPYRYPDLKGETHV